MFDELSTLHPKHFLNRLPCLPHFNDGPVVVTSDQCVLPVQIALRHRLRVFGHLNLINCLY